MAEQHRPGFPGVWGRAVGHMTNSVAEANRAAAAAFGAVETPDPPATEATAFKESDWTFERTAETRGELTVGDAIRFSKTLTDDDVHEFASATGDTNRLHLDDEFAGETRFGGRIVHGTLVAGLISAALARLPGLTIYLSQDLTFERPVRIGERLTAECEIVEALEGDRYRLTTVVQNDDGEAVIDGEAVVLIDSLPDDEPGGGATT